MILFFNITTLEQLANGNDKQVLSLLKDLYYNKLAIKYIKHKLIGSSFLLNPEPLFTSNIDISFIIQYIKLAAKRDYMLYKSNRYKSLDLSYYPDIRIDSIKANPLLKINKTEIKFFFEET